jgi:uncharacterized protein (TIGR03437 family)
VVPQAVAGKGTVNVVVNHPYPPSAPFPVSVVDTSPGIYTVSQNGTGPGLIRNVGSGTNTYTMNSATNPVAKGSAITLFATGAGPWTPALPDGGLVVTMFTVNEVTYYAPIAPVSLTIGGQPAKVIYAGVSPYTVNGILQVNAIVPNGIGSGAQPIVLTAGQNSNAQQQVTVFVQ